MSIDSDVANADSHMFVEFYTFDREPHKDIPFVRIMSPGDKTNIIETFAKDFHKQRFPRQWLHYQMQNDGSTFIGTPLSEWATAKPEEMSGYQMAELGILKFQTVEQIATASDAQLQRVGMGSVGLRDRAREFLKAKNQSATSSELEDTKAELEKLKAQVSAMAEYVERTNEKRGPGRPRKAE